MQSSITFQDILKLLQLFLDAFLGGGKKVSFEKYEKYFFSFEKYEKSNEKIASAIFFHSIQHISHLLCASHISHISHLFMWGGGVCIVGKNPVKIDMSNSSIPTYIEWNFRFFLNQSENCNYNLILVASIRIRSRFLCV